MEIFLASDVIYSQRVAPLIQQTLAANGDHGIRTSPSSRFLPNLGWLEPNTVSSRLTGTTATPEQPRPRRDHHGSALKGVSVGSTERARAEPALNHISGGGSPTFTVQVEDTGEYPETNVKVDVTVTAGGKQYQGLRHDRKDRTGQDGHAEVTVTGIPTGAGHESRSSGRSRCPGETNHENNKNSYLAIFE